LSFGPDSENIEFEIKLPFGCEIKYF